MYSESKIERFCTSLMFGCTDKNAQDRLLLYTDSETQDNAYTNRVLTDEQIAHYTKAYNYHIRDDFVINYHIIPYPDYWDICHECNQCIECFRHLYAGSAYVTNSTGKRVLNVDFYDNSNWIRGHYSKALFKYIRDDELTPAYLQISWRNELPPVITRGLRVCFTMYHSFNTKHMIHLMTMSQFKLPTELLNDEFIQWYNDLSQKQRVYIDKILKRIQLAYRYVYEFNDWIYDALTNFSSHIHFECGGKYLHLRILRGIINQDSECLSQEFIYSMLNQMFDVAMSQESFSSYNCTNLNDNNVYKEMLNIANRIPKDLHERYSRYVKSLDNEHQTIGLYNINRANIKDDGLCEQYDIKFVELDTSRPIDEIECHKRRINLVIVHEPNALPYIKDLHLISVLYVDTNNISNELTLLLLNSHHMSMDERLNAIVTDQTNINVRYNDINYDLGGYTDEEWKFNRGGTIKQKYLYEMRGYIDNTIYSLVNDDIAKILK